MENEIKVNEYIRTEYGEIAKVIEYKNEIVFDKEIKFYGMYRGYICEDELNFIVKHSPNLIDIIQCGDYVNGKEVIMDLQKSKEWYKSKDDFITCKDYTFEEKEIKEVVTKEQFESISYKVTKM